MRNIDTVNVVTRYLLLAASIFFKILQNVTVLTQFSLSHLQGNDKSKCVHWQACKGANLISPQLQTRLPQALAAAHPAPPSWPEFTTWDQVVIFHLCRLPQCRLFWAHLCTEGTRVPRSLLVPKDNPSAPQIHSCRSPVEVVTYMEDMILGNLPCRAFPHPFL